MLKHKPIASTLAVALAATMLLFTSCVPENADPAADLPKGAIRLVSEGFRSAGGTKLGVDTLGANVHFIAGDSLWVNGQLVEVKQSSTTAYIQLPDDMETSELIAVYPYSIVEAYDEGAGTIDVQLPGSYQYRVDPNTGRQNVQAPLFARLTAPSSGTNEGRTLQFSHLSAAITLAIKNSTSADIKLKDILLSIQNNYFYRPVRINKTSPTVPNLNDIYAISSDDIEATFSNAQEGTDYGNEIHYKFDNEECSLSANSTIYLQIPVAPIHYGNTTNPITVSISADHDIVGMPNFQFVYNRTQTGNRNVLAQNDLIYAPIDFNLSDAANFKVDGTFSVNASGKKVFFSKSNLKYRYATPNVSADVNNENYFSNRANWAMKKSQDSIPTIYTGSISISAMTTDNLLIDFTPAGGGTGWLEYFMFGANGKRLHPRTMHNNSDFAIITGNIQGTDDDWGKRFGDGNWITLSEDEWNYLLSESSGRMAASPEGIRDSRPLYRRSAIWATVNGKKGVIILPDKYWASVKTRAAATVDETTTPKWSEMEKYGAVFLPANGYLQFAGRLPSKRTVSHHTSDDNAIYWTSTQWKYTMIGVSGAGNVNTLSVAFEEQTSTLSATERRMLPVRLVYPAN